jgi:splicing factor 3B subunit 3
MACSNSRQLIISVENDQLIYFEIDRSSGCMLTDRGQKLFKQEIKAIDVGEVPEQRQRFKFLIVAFQDQTLRVLSLEPDTCLNRVSMLMLPLEPSSVSLIELNNQLYLHIGMENGVLMRSFVDSVTGGLSDSRQQYLGVGRVELAKVQVNGRKCQLVLAARPYLCYSLAN